PPRPAATRPPAGLRPPRRPSPSPCSSRLGRHPELPEHLEHGLRMPSLGDPAVPHDEEIRALHRETLPVGRSPEEVARVHPFHLPEPRAGVAVDDEHPQLESRLLRALREVPRDETERLTGGIPARRRRVLDVVL